MTVPIQPERFDREGAKRAGYSDQEIDDFLAKANAPQRPTIGKFASESSVTPATKQPDVKGLANDWPEVVREVGRGMSFGLTDKLKAAEMAVRGPQTYSESRDAIKATRKDFGERHPVLQPVANAGGALLTARFIPSLTIGSGLTAGSRIASGAANGALQGAAAGALSADGTVGDRVMGGLKGGGAGLAMGGTFAGATELLRGGAKAVRGVKDALGTRKGQYPAIDDELAARETLPLIARSGKTVDQVRTEAQAADPADIMAEVIGPRGVKVIGSAHRFGLQPEPIAKTLDARAMDEAPNFANKLEQLTGAKIRDAASVADEAMQAAKPAAETGYALARKQPDVDSPEIVEMVGRFSETKHGKAILDHARELGATFGSLRESAEPTNTVSVENLHYLRQAVDAQVKVLKSRGETSLAAALQGRRKELDTILKAYGGKGQVAADAAIEAANARGEAFSAGERIRSGADPASATEEGIRAARTSARDAEAFRQGAASNLQNTVRSAKDGTTGTITNPARDAFGSPKVEARAREAFKDDASFLEAKTYAERMGNRFRTRNSLAGSNSMDKMASDLDEMAPGFLEALASGNIKGAAKAGIKVAGQGARGASLDRKARILLAGGPGQLTKAEANDLLAAAEKFALGQTARQSRTAATAGRLAGGAAGRP